MPEAELALDDGAAGAAEALGAAARRAAPRSPPPSLRCRRPAPACRTRARAGRQCRQCRGNDDRQPRVGASSTTEGRVLTKVSAPRRRRSRSPAAVGPPGERSVSAPPPRSPRRALRPAGGRDTPTPPPPGIFGDDRCAASTKDRAPCDGRRSRREHERRVGGRPSRWRTSVRAAALLGAAMRRACTAPCGRIAPCGSGIPANPSNPSRTTCAANTTRSASAAMARASVQTGSR